MIGAQKPALCPRTLRGRARQPASRGRRLAEGDPEPRRQIYELFQFSVELDRNKPEVRMKALVSTAFIEANDLEDLAVLMVADKSIAGERFAPNGNPVVSVERTFPGWPGS
jgi:hypothetical protein